MGNLKTYQHILLKLNGFCRKYYTRLLIRGGLLFSALGALLFFGLLSVEYLLWLSPLGRLILLFFGLILEVFLLYRYILTPLFYLFKLRKGISHKQASILIGRHFPEVGDKLYNLLDLAENPEQSELLLASMEQRSRLLSPIPFSRAVDYGEAFKYAKYCLFPVGLVLIIWTFGSLSDFFGSYQRVVHFYTAYQPPAPFVFEPLMGKLEVLENEPFTVQVGTKGSVRPDKVSINLNGREYLMKEDGGVWFYTFQPPLQSLEFYFSAEDIKSQVFEIKALKVPAIEDFRMKLTFPAYLRRAPVQIRSTGNATFPEGTEVTWRVKGRNTDRISLQTPDTVQDFKAEDQEFRLIRKIFRNLDYQVRTSNEFVKGYDLLKYSFKVIRDADPKIRVMEIKDSLDPRVRYYSGEVSDDYGLKSIKLVAYPAERPTEVQEVALGSPVNTLEQFYYTFPSGLLLPEGVNYEYYFTVTDNDGIHGGKTSRSQTFETRVLTDNELRKQNLQTREELLEGMGQTFERIRDERDELKAISQTQKEKEKLNYTEQSQMKEFFDKQKSREEMMEKFSRDLKQNLGEEPVDKKMSRLLKERLERRELEAQKNARLLEELKKVADKINKEDLEKRLEELSKQRQNDARSLEQILELTKRYYVTEKAAQLAKQLQELGKAQQKVAEIEKKEDSLAEKQNELNKEFEENAREIDSLLKDNNALKKPMDFNISKDEKEVVKQGQQDIMDRIREGSDAEGRKAMQKQIGKKIGEMGDKLQQASQGSAGDSAMEEDAKMLRQILDNLITFSFKQEKLFDRLQDEGGELDSYSDDVREQQELRELFGHIDDSLFALSLRRVEISDLVNEQITNVYYNVDKSLESITDNRIYQGVSYQQYVLTAANTLADFLADVLENMQENLKMGAGQGNSQEGFQLPDIIQSQQELKERLKGDMGSQGQGGKQEEGKGNKPGKSGQKGQQQGKNRNGDGGKENNGQEKGGENGNGAMGLDEEGLKELYEIYKQQQQLRQELEEQLKDLINEKDRALGQKILKQMEDFENNLLENGITQRSLERMTQIEHQLLQLENAAFKQGEKDTRESQTNKMRYTNPITTRPAAIKNSANDIENLIREALPLHQVFQNKVKAYFREKD